MNVCVSILDLQAPGGPQEFYFMLGCSEIASDTMFGPK